MTEEIKKITITYTFYCIIPLFNFSNQELQDIAMELNLIPDQEKRLIENWYRYDSEFLLSLLVCLLKNT